MASLVLMLFLLTGGYYVQVYLFIQTIHLLKLQNMTYLIIEILHCHGSAKFSYFPTAAA